MEDKYRVPERVVRMVERAEKNLSGKKTKASEYYKLYMRILPRKRPKRSNLFIPKTTSMVENAVARYVEAMFQYTPYFDLESRSGEHVQEADNAEKCLQFFLERAELLLKCITWFKQSAIEGIGVMKVGWKKVVRTQKQRMALDEAMETIKDFKLPKELRDVKVYVGPDGDVHVHTEEELDEEFEQLYADSGYQLVPLDQAPKEVQNQFTVTVKAPKTVYDGLEFTPIDWQDCFWDTDASNVDELRFAGHYVGRTLADLKEEKKSGVSYKNLDKLEELANSGSLPDIARYRRRSDVGDVQDKSADETLFKVTEFWHVQEQKLYTFVQTGNGDGIIIREEDWPYWHGELPYHYLPHGVVPFELIGVSIPELMEHLQNEKNDIRNIMMDLKTLAICPPIFYNESVIFDPSELDNLEPNKRVGVEAEANYALSNLFWQPSINPASFQHALILERAIDQDIEEATGINKVNQGVALNRRTTYSEQSLLANEANFRFRLQIRVIDAVMKRMAKQAIRLLDQFLDPQVEIRITGDDQKPAFMMVDRADLALEYDVYPASSSVESLANQLAQANNIIQGYTAIRNSPMEQVIKHASLAREYFRKLGLKDVNNFIKSDDELAAEMQAQMGQMVPQMETEPGMAPPGMPGVQEGEDSSSDEMALIAQENDMMMQGQAPQVEEWHNHQAHLQGHDVLRAQLEQELLAGGITGEDALNDPRVLAVIEHLQEHMMMGGFAGGREGAVSGTDTLSQNLEADAGYSGMEGVPEGT